MKKIQVLGSGCPKCKQLAANAATAIEGVSDEFEVVKVTDINEMMSMGVMMTPALAIDGEVKSAGKVLSVDEIKKLIL